MRSIALGVGIALVQSLITTAALSRAWKSKRFYWVWGGMFFFRFLVFAGTAFWVYRYTNLHLAVTLVSLVAATTIFLVAETYIFLERKNGFSSSSRTSSTRS